MRTILTTARRDDRPSPYGAGRTTSQRRLIAQCVPETAFTVAELARLVGRRDPRVGLATVYRAVGAMESSGWIAKVGDADGTALYARCTDAGHHHHAVCTRCGRVEHTPCPVDAASPPAPDGFRVTDHELTLYGVCAECDRARAAGEPQ